MQPQLQEIKLGISSSSSLSFSTCKASDQPNRFSSTPFMRKLNVIPRNHCINIIHINCKQIYIYIYITNTDAMTATTQPPKNAIQVLAPIAGHLCKHSSPELQAIWSFLKGLDYHTGGQHNNQEVIYTRETL